MKNFLKKYVKFSVNNANIVICVIAILIGICTGDYFHICGWLSALGAWVLVAFMENWNDELLDARFKLENKLTDLHIKNVELDRDKEHNEKDIDFLKQCSLNEITDLKNCILKMQEENEYMQTLLHKLTNK